MAAAAAPASHAPRPEGQALRREARCRLATGDLDGAIAHHVAALAVDPEIREDARRLQIVLDEVGRTQQAARLHEALERARLADYQRGVDRLRASPYLDFPRHVHLETMARCNARCTFCPSSELARSGARMDDALLDKVLSDLEAIPRDVPFQLSPFKVNEPFLDVRLFDLLDAIETRLPHATISLTTNASPLTANKLARLQGRSALRDLYVSFNDHRPDAYEATMGLPFARTLARLDLLHEAVAGGSLDLRVTLSRVGDGTKTDLAFRTFVAERFPAFGALVMRRGDWLGQVQTDIATVPDVGCQRWFELSITATGVVAHCCMDGQAAWPLGDVAEQHALAIYNQPAWRRVRAEVVSRRATHPCDGCTFF